MRYGADMAVAHSEVPDEEQWEELLPKLRGQVLGKLCALMLAALGAVPAPAAEVRTLPDLHTLQDQT